MVRLVVDKMGVETGAVASLNTLPDHLILHYKPTCTTSKE